MRKFQGLVAAAFVTIAASVASAQVKGMGRLNGKVTDAGGAPVDGVSIKLHQGTDVIEATTNAKGDWVLAGVARGNWLVTFEKDGFPTKNVKVVVEKELLRTEPIKITMKKGV